MKRGLSHWVNSPVLNHINPFHSVLPCFFRVNCNVIFQFMPRSSKWSLSFRSPHQKSVSTSSVSYNCHTSRPPNYLLIWSLEYLVRSTDHKAPGYVVFSTLLLSRLSFESKYLPQYPILEHPQPMFLQYTSIYTYTECPGGNVLDFGRLFLKLKYTDITKNTYIRSWTVTEIMAREVWKYDRCYTLIHYQIHIKTGRNMWFL